MTLNMEKFYVKQSGRYFSLQLDVLCLFN